MIQSRPNTAPVLVVRDWEAADKAKYDAVLAIHRCSKCLIAPEAKVNPALDEAFVGVERFLSTPFIEKVIPASNLGRENGLPDARYTIKKKAYFSFKQLLVARAEAGDDVGPHMRDLATWLDAEIVGTLNSIPASEFS